MKKVLCILLLGLLLVSFTVYALEKQDDNLSKIKYNNSGAPEYATEDNPNNLEIREESLTVVYVELNYDQFEPLKKSLITESNVDDIIKLNRNQGKNYHQSRNENIGVSIV